MKLRHLSRTSQAALAVALAMPVFVALPSAAQAQAPAQSFSIPAGDLGVALQAFSTRTGIQLVYSSDLVAGKRTAGVSGEMNAQVALGRLLAGTGLSARMSGNSATLVQAGAEGEIAAQDGERVLGPVRVEGSQEGSGSAYEVPRRGEGAAQLGGVRGGQREEADGLRAKVSSIATGYPLAIEDTPRSVTVQTQELLEKQDISSLDESLERTAGVTISPNATNLDISVRGYALSSIQVDGGAAQNLSLYPGRSINLDAYERVELVRGGNSLFAGADSAGGSINLVRKRPGSEPSQSITLQGGSYSKIGVIADVSTPSLFGSPISFRAVASIRRDPGYVDNFSSSSKTLYGIADIPFGDDARMEVGVNYSDVQVDGQYYGAFRAATGKLLDVPRSFNIGLNGAYSKSRSTEIFSKFYANLGPKWDLELSASLTNARTISSQILLGSPAFFEDGTVQSPDFNNFIALVDTGVTKPSSVNLSAKLTGEFSTFGLDHHSLISVSQNSQHPGPAVYANGIGIGSFTSIDDLRNVVLTPISGQTLRSGISSFTAGVALSHTISWRDRIYLTASARRDVFESDRFDVAAEITNGVPAVNGVSISLPKAKASWQPSYSVSVKPFENLTLYGSTFSGFRRQDQLFTRLGDDPNFTYRAFTPLRFRTQEVGAKLAVGQWFASIAAYDTKLSNVAVPNFTLQACPNGDDSRPIFTCYFSGPGLERTRGIEFELAGRLLPGLKAQASAAYTKATKIEPEGATQRGTLAPQFSARLNLDYTPQWLPDASFQLSTAYKGRYYADGTRTFFNPDGQPIPGQIDLPYVVEEKAYVLIDAGAEYRMSKDLTLRLFVKNLLDKKYLASPNPASTLTYLGEPRTVMATLKWSNIGPSAFDRSTMSSDKALFGEPSSWYAAFDLGYTMPETLNATAAGAAQDGTSRVRWGHELGKDVGYFARVGHYLTPNIRVELEGQHRSADIGNIGGGASAPFGVCSSVSALEGQPFDCDDVGGTMKNWSLIGNLLYDFGAPESAIRPYVGGGVGITRTRTAYQGKLEGIGLDTPWQVEYCDEEFGCFVDLDYVRQLQETIGVNDTSYALTLQAIAGVSVKVSDRLRIDASYRANMVRNARWDSYNLDQTGYFGLAEPLTPRLGELKGNSLTHSFSIGARWSF